MVLSFPVSTQLVVLVQPLHIISVNHLGPQTQMKMTC